MPNISSDRDPRERPKTGKTLSAKRTKSRTKTGCFTCRKRKKKCDEKGPVCSACARNMFQCCWPQNPTDALPKDFEITPLSANLSESFDKILKPSVLSKRSEIKLKIESKDLQKKKIDPVTDVPLDLCSVFEVTEYKHKRPFPSKVTIPDSIDKVVDDLSSNASSTPTHASSYAHSINMHEQLLSFDSFLLSPLTNSDTVVNQQSITQLFDSLYEDALDSQNSSPEAFYDDLLNYRPKSEIPNTVIKNPILAAIREIFYARGCSYLAKNNVENPNFVEKYSSAANTHYTNAVNAFAKGSEDINCMDYDNDENWTVFAIKTICFSEKLLGLVSESCIADSMVADLKVTSNEANLMLTGIEDASNRNLGRVLFSQVLFSYPFLVYLVRDISSIIPPSQVFDKYNNEIIDIFSSSADSESWLDTVLQSSTITILQMLSKLLWNLRMQSKAHEVESLRNNLDVITQTIQTAELQAPSQSFLLYFARFANISLNVLYNALTKGPSNNNEEQIDEFIFNYESFVQSKCEKLPKCYTLMPLFIIACASNSLRHREFVSKELYLLSQRLGLEFLETLTRAIEDTWCSQQRDGVSSLERFVSRTGFLHLVV